MTRSGLATRVVTTRKYSSREGHRPERFILHHTAGGSNEGNLRLLSDNNGYEVSCNYLSFTDGTLVSIVPEELRAWTTGWNADKNSITQETVNTSGAPQWLVSAKQVEMTAKLLADLSRRYGWGPIKRGKNFMVHQDFNATACPGPYLMGQLAHIEKRANEILKGNPAPAPNTPNAPKSPEEDENNMKGLRYTRASDKREVYMIFNEVSGFYSEHTTGGGGPYNNPLATHWRTGSWPTITENHAAALKRNLDKVRLRTK